MFLYTCFLSLYAKYCFSLEFEEPGELAFVLIYIGHPDKAPQPSESDSIYPSCQEPRVLAGLVSSGAVGEDLAQALPWFWWLAGNLWCSLAYISQDCLYLRP